MNRGLTDLERQIIQYGNFRQQKRMEDAEEAFQKLRAALVAITAASETSAHFTTHRPLPQELGEVLAEYDLILAKADLLDPEWDFVMRAADWRIVREFFATLKPTGAPTVITNPPRPA